MEPTIHLLFRGDCLEAMTLYAETLGGAVEGVFRGADARSPEARMPGGGDRVMNMMVRLGATRLMASDIAPEDRDPARGYRFVVEAPSLAEFERIHAALSAGAGSEEMAPGETFWAKRFAMFTDRYGTPWMLILTGA